MMTIILAFLSNNMGLVGMVVTGVIGIILGHNKQARYTKLYELCLQAEKIEDPTNENKFAYVLNLAYGRFPKAIQLFISQENVKRGIIYALDVLKKYSASKMVIESTTVATAISLLPSISESIKQLEIANPTVVTPIVTDTTKEIPLITKIKEVEANDNIIIPPLVEDLPKVEEVKDATPIETVIPTEAEAPKVTEETITNPVDNIVDPVVVVTETAPVEPIVDVSVVEPTSDVIIPVDNVVSENITNPTVITDNVVNPVSEVVNTSTDTVANPIITDEIKVEDPIIAPITISDAVLQIQTILTNLQSQVPTV